VKTVKTPKPITQPKPLATLVRYGRSRRPAYVIYQSDVEEVARRLSGEFMSNLLSGLRCADACSNALFSLGITPVSFSFKVPQQLATRIEITGNTRINPKLTKVQRNMIKRVIHKHRIIEA
jgi:hypothetical protein